MPQEIQNVVHVNREMSVADLKALCARARIKVRIRI